jgi:hypothetical protein
MKQSIYLNSNNMNKKNIIIPASILTILIALFIIFNPTNINKNSNTNQSSISSSTTSNLPPVTIKDNKTIELEPNLKENWDYKEKIFIPVASGTPDFPTKGLSGTRQYVFPLGSNNPQYELNIFNSNLPTTTDNILYVSKFIQATQDLRSVSNRNNVNKVEDFSELRLPFTDTTDFRTANKLLNRDIAYDKPPQFQAFKVFLSKDGNGNPLSPVLNIIGQLNNDYFLLENNLRDINTQAIFNQAIKDCGQTTDNCVATKADSAIEIQLTNEYIDSNIKSMLKTLKI